MHLPVDRSVNFLNITYIRRTGSKILYFVELSYFPCNLIDKCLGGGRGDFSEKRKSTRAGEMQLYSRKNFEFTE